MSLQIVLVSCGAGGEYAAGVLGHEDGPLYARCVEGTTFEISSDYTDDVFEMKFKEMGCEAQPVDSNQVVGRVPELDILKIDNMVNNVGKCGPNDEGTEVIIGFDILPAHEGTETPVLTVCYDVKTSVNLWSRNTIWDEVNAQDHGNDSPFFNPDDYFDYDVNHYYTMASILIHQQL